MQRIAVSWCLGLILTLSISQTGYTETDGNAPPPEQTKHILTLKDAVQQALTQSPELAVFSLEKRIREARTLQAGLLPNPTLGITVENAAGSGIYNGFGRAETTIQLSQLVELGGKRAARIEMTTLSRELADWDYEIKRMEVLTRISKEFVDVLKAQQKVTLAEELTGLGRQFSNAVAERADAGKVAAIEKVKAEVALSNLQIELDRARLELENARRRLTILWGQTEPQFKSAEGDLFTIPPAPALESLAERLPKNPRLSRWTTELKQRQALLDLELSRQIPDVTFNGGYRRLEETEDNAIVFGLSVPFPLFDRNQGAVSAARHRLEQAQEQQRMVEMNIQKTLREAYQTLLFFHSQVIRIKNGILPGAEHAFESVREGYRFGKFGLLDVLDSQQTFFKARSQYLDALADYHKSVADVESLTGEPLASVIPVSDRSAGEEQE